MASQKSLTITEPVLIELINSQALQRLKKIHQLDPDVLEKGMVRRLSAIDSDYADQLSDAGEFPQELFLRFDR